MPVAVIKTGSAIAFTKPFGHYNKCKHEPYTFHTTVLQLAAFVAQSSAKQGPTMARKDSRVRMLITGAKFRLRRHSVCL